MTGRSSALVRTLLLVILVAGPLQAQSVFACSLMDEVKRGDCCCIGHSLDEHCPDAKCDAAFNADAEPCCERSVEVSIREDARQNTPVVNSVEVRAEMDPPPTIAPSPDELFPPQSAVAICVDFPRSALRQSGSDTYLLTQRLRI